VCGGEILQGRSKYPEIRRRLAGCFRLHHVIVCTIEHVLLSVPDFVLSFFLWAVRAWGYTTGLQARSFTGVGPEESHNVEWLVSSTMQRRSDCGGLLSPSPRRYSVWRFPLTRRARPAASMSSWHKCWIYLMGSSASMWLVVGQDRFPQGGAKGLTSSWSISCVTQGAYVQRAGRIETLHKGWRMRP